MVRKMRIGRKVLLKSPVYEFDPANNTFRRHFGRPWEKNMDLFVNMRPVNSLRKGRNKKNEIEFLNLEPRKYPLCKVAMLNELLFDSFLPRYGSYFSFNQRELEFKKRKKQFKPRKNPFASLRGVPVYLIDNVGEEDSVRAIIDWAKKYDVKIRTAKKVNPNRINLQLNHNLEAYRQDDPYQKSSLTCAIQNFTLEEFKNNGTNQLFKTLLEAHIKWDIVQNQLTVFNWSSLGFAKPWYFAIF